MDKPTIDFNYFIDACKKGILPIIKESLIILENELNVNIQNIINHPYENDMSGYMHAVNNNRVDVVRYFLYNYDDCDNFYINMEGYSAISIAVKNGFFDCLKYILCKDSTIKYILKNLKDLKLLYNDKKKIYNKIDTLIDTFGEQDPRISKLFSKLNEKDDLERIIYSNLDLSNFEQIILCFEIRSNPIIKSLLINTFGSYDNLVYIYTNMCSESGDVF